MPRPAIVFTVRRCGSGERERAILGHTAEQHGKREARRADPDHARHEANRVRRSEREQEERNERDPALASHASLSPLHVLLADPPPQERQPRPAPDEVRGVRSYQRSPRRNEHPYKRPVERPREDRHEDARNGRDQDLGDHEGEEDERTPGSGAPEKHFDAGTRDVRRRSDGDPYPQYQHGDEDKDRDPGGATLGLGA